MFEPSKHLVLLIFLSSLIDVIDTCSPACVSCINVTCMKCDVGNYLGSGSCYTCPAHCTSCNNSGVCYNCTEGYYGLTCDRNCVSSLCLNNTCNKDGACLHGCIEGYFLSGSSCYPCAADCKTCANFSNNCLECKDGYYGPSCQYSCSHCKDGICTRDNCTYGCGNGFFRGSQACNSCNINCTSCSIEFHNCTACVDGYFGSACQFTCSDCSPCNQDGSCPKTTGQAPTSTTQVTSPWNGGKAKQSDKVAENIDMTENENYISAEDIEEISRNSSNAQNDVKQNKQEDNAGDLYSMPNKINHPTTVNMESGAGQETEDSPSNLSPTIPVKSNMYSDLI